jgi:hypothetical protein
MFCTVRAAAPRSLLRSASAGGAAAGWPACGWLAGAAGAGARSRAGAFACAAAGGWRGRLCQHRLGPGAVPAAAEGAVVGEERPPGLVDRTGIVEVPLVQLIDQPLIGAEVGAARHGARLR